MTGWLMPLCYVVGYVFSYRRIWIAADGDQDLRANGGFDTALLVAVCMMTAVFWPLMLVGYGLWLIATPVTPRQRKEELDKREAEIERLERELGIKRPRP